jgi:hypothetical protein
MTLEGDKSAFDYAGDCFPSLQAFDTTRSGNHYAFGFLNSPPSSVQKVPGLHRGCDAHADVPH